MYYWEKVLWILIGFHVDPETGPGSQINADLWRSGFWCGFSCPYSTWLWTSSAPGVVFRHFPLCGSSLPFLRKGLPESLRIRCCSLQSSYVEPTVPPLACRLSVSTSSTPELNGSPFFSEQDCRLHETAVCLLCYLGEGNAPHGLGPWLWLDAGIKHLCLSTI